MLLMIDGEGNIINFPKQGGFLDQPADWMEVMSLVVNKLRMKLRETYDKK